MENPTKTEKGTSKEMPQSEKTINNYSSYMLDLKGKKYLPAAARIAWFRDNKPEWTIKTKVIAHNVEQKRVMVRATVENEEGRVISTAHKTESATGFEDYIEKAESGAISRALAFTGYGTLQAIELDEVEDVSDAPVSRS